MKKNLCLLLASLMFLSLVSCGNVQDDKETGTSGNQTTRSDQTEAETKDMSFTCELPEDLHFHDEKIHIIFCDVPEQHDQLIPSEDKGVVSSAVHDRNVMTEEMIHVKLDCISGSGDGYALATMVDRDIKSGNGDYDIIANKSHIAITPAMEGKYLNLHNVDYIDTDKHYWTQGYNDMMTFTNKNLQFLASGPIAISMFRLMYMTIYNKTLFEDNQIPDLYETVRNGDWTLDYQLRISTDHYLDSDGDHKRSLGDSYGFVTGDVISVDPYLVASDIHMVIKESDTANLMYNKEATAALSDLCDKVQDLYNDESTYVFKGIQNDVLPGNEIARMFTDGNSLMATFQFIKMELHFDDLSSMSYGIAPIPKFAKEQAEYHSYVQDSVTSFGISAGVRNPDRQNMCGATLEAMTFHSYRLVRPAYYETVLSSRFMQDPQSNEILDMLFQTLDFDFSSTCSGCFTSCVIRDNLRPLLSGKRNSIASSTKKWDSAVNKTLKKYNANFDKLYG